MRPPVITKDPTAVAREVQAAYASMFPEGEVGFVPRVFEWAVGWFAGNYRDYQPVDALYHDLEHTLQGTLCLVRLLHRRQLAGAQPFVTETKFQLGLLAILLHDTGYLKKRDDTTGTGAKYTVTHVSRSANFAAELLADKGFGPADIRAVQNMIRCTGWNAALSSIHFQDEPEKIVGFALGTADLLGQMAAPDYVDKLPVLYMEFAEAAEFSKEKDHFVGGYSSAADLMRKTPGFWEGPVRRKLDQDFERLYDFLNDPYPDGPNPYLDQIEANMERLRLRVAANG